MRLTTALFCIGLATCACLARAEDTAASSVPIEQRPLASTQTNLAVPDIPAFHVLGTTPSELLRPANVKDLTAVVAGIIEENGFRPPKTLALELAPWLLFHGEGPLVGDYRPYWDHVLYSTRFSLGITPQDTGGGLRMGVGLRTTFCNNGELALSDTFFGVLGAATTFYNDSFSGYKNRNPVESVLARLRASGDTSSYSPVRLESLYNSEANSYARARFEERYGTPRLGVYVDRMIDSFATAIGWNRSLVDGAVAVLMTTADSLGNDLQVPAAHAWASASLPLGRNGQFVGGLSARFPLGSGEPPTVAASARGYVGRNNAKWMLDAQLKTDTPLDSILVSAGTGLELGLWDVAWLDIRVGPEARATEDGWRWRLAVRFDVHTGTVGELKVR
ncbi:hypothetical protein FJY71_01210 [candidate division WOR-3 bacterium]|nr:hypothetical protein [candidate division WOR-3 bacterium]